jgi:hypothetical protein
LKQFWYEDGRWHEQELWDCACYSSGPAAIKDNGHLLVFARDTYGRVWVRVWTGTYWAALGMVGHDAASPLSAVDAGYLTVFARNTRGRLQMYWHNGTAWISQEFPEVTLSSGPSAVVYQNILRVWARGTDGKLYQHYWTDRWISQQIGGAIGGGPGAMLPWVFVRAVPSGTPWQFLWSGAAWIATPIGGQIT